MANCKYRLEDHAFVITPMGDGEMRQREYRLSPDLVADILPQGQGLSEEKVDLIAYFESKGVTFPPGSCATYVPSRGRLVVRNTEENVDLVEKLASSLTKAADSIPSDPVEAKMARIVIPRFEVQESPLRDALQLLERKLRELDPDGTGVRLKIVGEVEAPPSITISLKNVPANETLRYVTALANHKFRFSADDQVIVEPTYTTALITKVYRVPAKSISTQEGTVKGPDGVTYPSVHELLTAFGVTFPEGATAGLPIGGEGIAMRNTQANLDIGEVIATALIEADGGKLSDDELDLLRTQIQGLKPVGR